VLDVIYARHLAAPIGVLVGALSPIALEQLFGIFYSDICVGVLL
jgi:hypothetical protein